MLKQTLFVYFKLPYARLTNQVFLILYVGMYNLTNRFQVAVGLFSNRSQMTSKCGKNKKSGTRGAAECVTDVLTTF